MDKLDVSKTILKSTKTRNKISWPDASKQFFSLPSSITYNIAKNPGTPEVYSKLIQTCKYFFEKNPILIVKRIHDGGRKLCSSDDCQHIDNKCCITIDVKKLSSKLWITTRLSLSNNFIHNAELLLFCSKLYQCQNAKLFLWRYKLSFEEFKLLALKFKRFYLRNVTIVGENENTVMLERVLETIPNVKDFDYCFDEFHVATTSTMKNICMLPNIRKLCCLCFLSIPQVFDVKDVENFIMAHKQTNLWFEFDGNLSEDYKKQLGDLVDTLIALELSKCVIYYPGLDSMKYGIMRKRYGC